MIRRRYTGEANMKYDREIELEDIADGMVEAREDNKIWITLKENNKTVVLPIRTDSNGRKYVSIKAYIG